MVTDQDRRRFLAGLGASGLAGVAGCLGEVRDRADLDQGSPTDADEGENENGNRDDGSDADSDTDQEQSLHSGAVIPTYPYADGEDAFEPTESRPDPDADNPVLTADGYDVGDLEGEALFVADPFVFVEDGEWHMFLEVLDTDHGGVIAHAESQDRGLSWEYTGIALKEEWHLANPLVWKWEDDHYMTTHATPTTRPRILYKANNFPHEWYPVVEPFDQREYDHEVTDVAFFRWEDRWWALAGGENRNTYVYHSDELEASDWEPHPDNPVVEDRPFASRPSGRTIVLDDRIFVPFQQTEDLYGESIQGYWITELTTEAYEDDHLGTVIQGTDRYTAEDEPAWNSLRMHHYDPWYLGDGEGWRVAVDGGPADTEGPNWAIGIYHIPE